MKKVLLTVLTCFVFVIASCSGTYIYAAIETEVKLKNASVGGTVSDIVKVGDNLYLSHGEIKTKKAFTEGQWQKLNPPKGIEANALCSSVATDGSVLYAAFRLEDKTKPSVYTYDAGTWNAITGTEGIDYVAGSSTVFAVKSERVSGDGTTVKSEKLDVFCLSSTSANKVKSYNVEGEAKHIVAVGDNYYATSEGVFDIDGNLLASSPTNIKAITKNAEYFLTADTLYKDTDFSGSSFKHGIASPNGAVLVTINGVERLLVSSDKGGYYEIHLDTDLANCKTVHPGSEDSTTHPSCIDQYKSAIGKYPCNKIFAESDGTDYYVYLNIHDTFLKYSGLWSYYSKGKQEWNRE